MALVKSWCNKLDQPAASQHQRRQRQHPCGLPEERRRRQAGGHAARRRCRGSPRRRQQRRASARPRPVARSANRGQPPQRRPPASQPSTGGQIQADPATNSLIITAPEPQYRQLRAVIDKLDARRAQVFVESLIVEVNADKLPSSASSGKAPSGQARRQHWWASSAPTSERGGNNILNLATARAPPARVAPRHRRPTSAGARLPMASTILGCSGQSAAKPMATATCSPPPIC